VPELTPTGLEIAWRAWVAARRGGAIVVADDAFPAAHNLAHRDWLTREFLDDDEMAWRWAPKGDTALMLGALSQGLSPN
jgi:hypothetical protein